MSSVVINGDTSGAITVAVPNVAGTNTVTIAAQTGTLNAAGPAFAAYAASTTSCTSGVNTKITFDAEDFDTNSNFASSRFTPTVAGYYQISAGVGVGTTPTSVYVMVYKNGSVWTGSYDTATTIAGTVSTLVYLNGSTDYVEVYANLGATQNNYANRSQTFFQGCLVRGA